MSELHNFRTRNFHAGDFRWQLLATVSGAALLLSVCNVCDASAAGGDADHPTVWVELGGQLERIDSAQEPFAPPFISTIVNTAGLTSPVTFEHPPRYSAGGEGTISFEPARTNWVFSATVRYGRSNGSKHVHQEADNPAVKTGSPTYPITVTPTAVRRSDTTADHAESHVIVDFQAGQDVGLGLFGRGASVLSAGVRFAQLNSKSTIGIVSDPDYTFKFLGPKYWHEYNAAVRTDRSFHGLGPVLSWANSTPVGGNIETGELAVDWGANAAILFGRQKAQVHQKTTSEHHCRPVAAVCGTEFVSGSSLQQGSYQYHRTERGLDQMRSRSVVVPNIGAFAGLSYRIENFKAALGYRADFFIGAMDGGIDQRISENSTFHGPFAKISIGLGG